MKARAIFAVVVLFLIVEFTRAGSVDKAKLRELADLPDISIKFGIAFSSISGFRFGENPDHLAEIARLQKQLKGDPSDAERYLLLGKHYEMAKRDKEAKEAKEAFAKAAAICRQQVREHPDDIRWLILLGETLIDNDEVKEAETLLRRAVKEAPNEWRGWLALAKRVDGQSAVTILGDKYFSFYAGEQEMIIPTLMERKPTEVQIAQMRRLRKEACGYYDRAIELAPHEEAKPYFRRWSSHHFHGILDAAIHTIKGEKVKPMAALLAPECLADMRQIARLSPDDPQTIGTALFCEIAACVSQDKLEMKEDCASWAEHLAARKRSLVDVMPAESRDFVHWCMERLEQLTKHSDKATAAAASEMLADGMFAIRSISVALEICWPNSANRGDIWKKEIEYLRQAVRLDPTRERAWDLLMCALAEEKKTDEAIAAARQRIEVKDNVNNRFYLAKAYADSDQFDKAAEELHGGLKSNPKDLNCLLGLVAVKLKRDNAQSLQEAGQLLDTIAPRFKDVESRRYGPAYLVLRGIHSALTDHPGRARAAFWQVLQMKKGDPTATRALGALDGPLGPADRQLAIDYIEKRSGRIEHKDGKASSPVKSIYLNRDEITDEDLFVLAAFPQLQELKLFFSAITDAGLAHLSDLTALRSLYLDGTKITDKGLIHLKALRELRELSLNETKITDAGLSHLETLPDLETLRIIGSSATHDKDTITDEGLAHLRKLPKLESVAVGSSITDKGLAHLATIPHLRRLFMLSSKITDEGMRHIERLSELEELWLSGTKITDAGLVHLKGLRNLRSLHLGGAKITDAGLAHLKELSRLEELELDGTAISDAVLEHLCGLANLQKLNLCDSERKNADLTLSTKPPLTGTGLRFLQGLTKLKYLKLDGRPISDAGLTDIEQLTQVGYLSLGATNITDEGLTHLHRLNQLKLVNVSNTKVTRQGAAELRKALPKLEVYR